MVARLTTRGGIVIHAIAVPQDLPSRTGPTWTYLFDAGGLTLIDAGALGSFDALEDGVRQAGFQVADISRIVISHGHQDHDGAATQAADHAGAELWAHDVYTHLLPYDPWDLQRRPSTPLQAEMHRIVAAHRGGSRAADSRETVDQRKRQADYVAARQAARVSGRIRTGDRIGDLEFMTTPGHSPDEICASLDGVVFTGDHVLPEITPHPTTKTEYLPEVADSLPEEHRDAGAYYGLHTYLRSLQQVADLGPDVVVLPAHRLFNRGRFNFQTVSRAKEIIDHHEYRLGRVMRRVGEGTTSLEEVTRRVFSRGALRGGNLYAALSEIVAHMELLEDTGDLDVSDGKLRAAGAGNYRRLFEELGT